MRSQPPIKRRLAADIEACKLATYYNCARTKASKLGRPKSLLTSNLQYKHLSNSHKLSFARLFILLQASLIFLLFSSIQNQSFNQDNQPSNGRYVLAIEVGSATNTTNAAPQSPSIAFKLDCQPGEQRQFSYESSTKVWGSSNQQVRLKATLRLKCMEAPTNTTLKYLAEVVSLTPSFLAGNQVNTDQRQPASSATEAKRARLSSSAKSIHPNRNHPTQSTTRHQSNLLSLTNDDDELQLRAEPLLEEVGEAASRMKRSVSGWFSKAWVSVKDFFGNIFTSSERSSVSREQALRETGLDIAGHCKAPSTGSFKGKGIQGLPFDESVFEDLGPEYYVGASSLDGATAYEFSGGDSALFGLGLSVGGEEDDDESQSLSFFDDPKPLRRQSAATRTRRAATASTSSTKRKSKTSTNDETQATDFAKLLQVPFVFLQSRSGKIIEVRFGGDDADLSVRNFKRHLCDLFATNLDASSSNKTAATTNEVSPIGKHQTKYTVDSSANSLEAMKQSVIKSAGGEAAGEAGRQLVRVLATVGATSARQHNKDSDGPELILEEDDEVEGAQRNAVNSGQISVLRTINTTSGVQLSSKMLASDIDRMEVRVKQLQQIAEGRLVNTAGQLSMSLLQPAALNDGQASLRNKRQVNNDNLQDANNIDDISELLQVSTSFSLQMVPLSDTFTFVGDSREIASREQRLRSRRSPPGETAGGSKTSNNVNENNPSLKKRIKKRGSSNGNLVRAPPGDSQELQRVLQEWRKQEARLQLSASNLISETSSQLENEQQRLDVLRDQIRQRLNEEFVRNRIRRSLSGHMSGQQQQQRVSVASSRASDDRGLQEEEAVEKVKRSGNDLGLGLTQLVLGNGITTKRKGSIYNVLEEVMELEASLSEDQLEGAISRLMRDTVRMTGLRQHCRAAIPTLEALCEAYKRPPASSHGHLSIERIQPFGLQAATTGDDLELVKVGDRADEKQPKQIVKHSIALEALKSAADTTNEFERKNERKFGQCRNMLQLMLKLNDRQAINLALELLDECNQRLLLAAKSEELGYGPVGKYYRHLRQQLVQTLSQLAKPSESLIEKLLQRLYYPKLTSGQESKAAAGSTRDRPSGSGGSRTATNAADLPDFVYVGQSLKPKAPSGEWPAGKYNKSLLKDEDDFNNNDGAGQLVMALTALAAKNSVSRSKRLEVIEKLLHSLRGTSCSLFAAPDLDILESMGHFQEPLDELASRVVALAKRCKHSDQYVAACVHGLAGQLALEQVQRFLGEQLRSPNCSCGVKSEIVLTLMNAQLVQDLKLQQGGGGAGEQTNGGLWPSFGMNRVDEQLSELANSRDKLREPDRRCLKQLAAHYFANKRSSGTSQINLISGKRVSRSRTRREASGAESFWDESQCKRWSLPANGGSFTGDLPNDLNSILSGRNESNNAISDLIDEIDDNSIISALINNQQQQQQHKTARSFRGGRGQRMVALERELVDSNSTINVGGNLQTAGGTSPNLSINQQANFLRRRHKCTASKNFGPRNAQANLRAEVVNDLIGSKDENKFLARFRLSTNFLGNRIDVGRMYLWHQRQTTRAYANILGRSIWDTSHGCRDKAPHQMLYMPLFDFNLWLVKVSVGLRLNAEMGFFSNCQHDGGGGGNVESGNNIPPTSQGNESQRYLFRQAANDELQLYPTVTLRAAGEASARLVVARAGMSLASHYGYQGSISVSRQPESCMSIYSAHQPMNVTFSSWIQLWDNDCHFWGSRNRAEPQATKWRLMARKPIVWLEDECLIASGKTGNNSSPLETPQGTSLSINKRALNETSARTRPTISP